MNAETHWAAMTEADQRDWIVAIVEDDGLADDPDDTVAAAMTMAWCIRSASVGRCIVCGDALTGGHAYSPAPLVPTGQYQCCAPCHFGRVLAARIAGGRRRK